MANLRVHGISCFDDGADRLISFDLIRVFRRAARACRTFVAPPSESETADHPRAKRDNRTAIVLLALSLVLFSAALFLQVQIDPSFHSTTSPTTASLDAGE